MPRKKDGMLFEIHPSPAKGKDGKNIVYVRPAGNLKLSMKGLEDYCNRNYRSLYGEIERSFDYFLRAAFAEAHVFSGAKAFAPRCTTISISFWAQAGITAPAIVNNRQHK